MTKPDLIVVGAGMFGATVAREAADAGKTVVVLDRRSHIAGNCFDYVDPETNVNVHKFGAHLFHTSNEKVWKFLNRFTEFAPYDHRVFANSGGQVYSFPMNLALLAQVFGRYFSPEEAKALILKETEGQDPALATNLEEKAISLIGKTLYEKFVKHYTAKQWETDPKELDPGIITRLPVRYNFDNRYFNDTYQGLPVNGYTAMFKSMLDHPNITVKLNVDWLKNPGEYTEGPIVYTGPLDEYFGHVNGRLPWRTVDLVSEVVDEDDFQGTFVMNYNDENPKFTRILEWRHADPLEKERRTEGKTIITREYSRFAGENDEPYYPINSTDTLELANKYKKMAKLEEANGVYFGGRLAGYLYYDMHQACNAAMVMFEKKIAPLLK